MSVARRFLTSSPRRKCVCVETVNENRGSAVCFFFYSIICVVDNNASVRSVSPHVLSFDLIFFVVCEKHNENSSTIVDDDFTTISSS